MTDKMHPRPAKIVHQTTHPRRSLTGRVVSDTIAA